MSLGLPWVGCRTRAFRETKGIDRMSTKIERVTALKLWRQHDLVTCDKRQVEAGSILSRHRSQKFVLWSGKPRTAEIIRVTVPSFGRRTWRPGPSDDHSGHAAPGSKTGHSDHEEHGDRAAMFKRKFRLSFLLVYTGPSHVKGRNWRASKQTARHDAVISTDDAERG